MGTGKGRKMRMGGDWEGRGEEGKKEKGEKSEKGWRRGG